MDNETIRRVNAGHAARVAELEIENAALRHDLERCMARELALLNPPQSDRGTE